MMPFDGEGKVDLEIRFMAVDTSGYHFVCALRIAEIVPRCFNLGGWTLKGLGRPQTLFWGETPRILKW